MLQRPRGIKRSPFARVSHFQQGTCSFGRVWAPLSWIRVVGRLMVHHIILFLSNAHRAKWRGAEAAIDVPLTFKPQIYQPVWRASLALLRSSPIHLPPSTAFLTLFDRLIYSTWMLLLFVSGFPRQNPMRQRRPRIANAFSFLYH